MCVDGPVFTYEEMLQLPPEFLDTLRKGEGRFPKEYAPPLSHFNLPLSLNPSAQSPGSLIRKLCFLSFFKKIKTDNIMIFIVEKYFFPHRRDFFSREFPKKRLTEPGRPTIPLSRDAAVAQLG